MSLNVLAAYIASVTALTYVLVELAKAGFLDRMLAPGPQRDAIITSVTYLLNFGLLLMVLATNQQFRPEDMIFYLLAATGQTFTASGAHDRVKKRVLERANSKQQQQQAGPEQESV